MCDANFRLRRLPACCGRLLPRSRPPRTGRSPWGRRSGPSTPTPNDCNATNTIVELDCLAHDSLGDSSIAGARAARRGARLMAVLASPGAVPATSIGSATRDQPRLGAQGSSSTVQRGGGHWSRAHSKKFWPSSSSTVRCCRPTTIQGLSGLCSVSVKPSFDTNVCSHDCQGCGCARADSSVAVAGSARKIGFVRSAWPSGSVAAALRGGRHRAAHDRARSAAAGEVLVPSCRAEGDE